MNLSVTVNIYQNDKLLGSTSERPVILIGPSALSRAGLTTLHNSILDCSTLYTGINGIFNPIAMWYFNPYAERYEHTKPSPVHPNILEPTQERALVEYMAYHDYFDEGVLIEGIKSYLEQHDNNYQALLDEADYWHYHADIVEYWIKEAKEDYEV